MCALLTLAAALVTVVVPAAQQRPAALARIDALSATYQAHTQQLAVGAHTIEVTWRVPRDAAAAQTQTLIAATAAGLRRLHEWLGPVPSASLIVVDVPWQSSTAGASYPGLVVTSTRWLSTPLDPAAERRLFAALARQYTFTIAAPGDPHAPFEEGLSLYLGARLIHDLLHNANFETPRFFGGFVPFSLRSVVHSIKPEDPRPQLAHLPDVEEPADAPWRAASSAPGQPARRIAAALQTFERHVGWPAFQQVLEQFMRRFGGRSATTADLAAVASELIGRDFSTFFAGGTLDEAFDYAIGEFRSDPAEGGFTITVIVRRTGAAATAALGLPLVLRLEDGTEITERIDAGKPEQTFVYRSASRAVLASVDPRAVLVIDTNRENNTRGMINWTNRIGLRLALNWMTWLQDAMLASTAIL
jgi:hypothetical protein